jgi:DNA primase
LDDSQPKYLNSPQTAIFDKSSILYAIDRAKGAIKEKGLAVIVEGYMDVITAHEYGFANVVASMGTALTEKQIKVLKGLTRSIAFALDPDVAGDAATLRAIEVARRSLEREDLEMPTWLGTTSKLRAQMKIIPLPQGKDPDLVIRDAPQSWQQLVENALPLMDHLLTVAASKADLTKPEERSRASEQLLPLIAELDDDVQREFYLGKLASLLGVSDKTLVGMAARLHRTRSEKVSKTENKPITPAYFGDPAEEQCLCLLLQHPELRDKAEGLLPEHFERTENREVFTAWRDTSNEEKLLLMLDDDLREHAKALCGKALPPTSERELGKALADCIRRLEERRLRLQEEFSTSEGVSIVSSMVSAGENLDSATLTIIQQKTVEVDAQLIKGMQENAGRSFPNREDQ